MTCRRRNRIVLHFAVWAAIVPISLATACASPPAPVATQSPVSPNLDEVLANVREAIGYERIEKYKNGIIVEYNHAMGGENRRCMLMIAPDGRFVHRIEDGCGLATGFDGNAGWSLDFSGMPAEQSGLSIDEARLQNLLRFGCWLNTEANLAIAVLDKQCDDDRIALAVGLRGSPMTRWLLIDRRSWLPTAICEPEHPEAPIELLENYRQVMNGFRLPHRLTFSEKDVVTTVFDVRAVACESKVSGYLYSAPTSVPDDSRFSPNCPPKAEMKLARKSPHVLVRCRIDGQEAGWCCLDSGAGFTMIDDRTADRLNVAVRTDLRGLARCGTASDMLPTPLRQAREVELGPMRIKDFFYMQIPLWYLAWSTGDQVSAIYGYDVFSRAVIVMDVSAGLLEFHDPKTFSINDVNWQSLTFDNRSIYLGCRFEGDREGLFLVDTGSDETIGFNSVAVKKYNLLEGRDTEETKVANVLGGSMSVREGKIAWFEIGGHRFDNPEATFEIPIDENQSGAEYDAKREQDEEDRRIGRVGSIGMGLLRDFRVIFDYPHKRIAILRPSEARSADMPSRDG